MGGQQSTVLKKEELEELHKKTHYERRELHLLYKQFKEEAPTGKLTKKDFRALTATIGISDTFITDIIFSAFDTKQDGTIEFSEFITVMSVLTRGSSEEKLHFAFRLYDLDGDGFISKAEMLKVVESLYSLLGDLTALQGEECDTPEKLVNRIFAEMDLDKDNRLSFDEYRSGAFKDSSIVKALALF